MFNRMPLSELKMNLKVIEKNLRLLFQDKKSAGAILSKYSTS